MFPDIPFYVAILFVLVGLYLLSWSANKFIDGSSAVAKALGVSPFIIGMVVIGFGTSAPELFVSALSGFADKSDLSLGNAYGSCIFNIAVILGVASIIRPLQVKPSSTFVAVPALISISALSCLLVAAGGGFSRMDGIILLVVFAVLLPVYCWFDQKQKNEMKAKQSEPPSDEPQPRMGRACFDLVLGLALLVGSSHILVWGSVDLARAMGVSELLIGLTIVAAGTSLPELASAVVSARKGEHEFVLGNIIGSNFFNTLAVVGLAGSISPFKNISPYVLSRDMPVMMLMSLLIAVFGVNFRRPRRSGFIDYREGIAWILMFLVYLGVMIYQETNLFGN